MLENLLPGRPELLTKFIQDYMGLDIPLTADFNERIAYLRSAKIDPLHKLSALLDGMLRKWGETESRALNNETNREDIITTLFQEAEDSLVEYQRETILNNYIRVHKEAGVHARKKDSLAKINEAFNEYYDTLKDSVEFINKQLAKCGLEKVTEGELQEFESDLLIEPDDLQIMLEGESLVAYIMPNK